MSRIPLYYTFGNHQHWVDMQWLWGYYVLPDSIRDMIHFCRETGAKGNVNFDGIGYEKLAAENPEALAELREAVQSGLIEPVGCSYGQPYGLFQGGESNVRQRVYGARAVRRLLGVWPKTFWEEEFDFFPQLPQMLKGTGFEYASLFFQWTWHTPEIPKEDAPVVWWEGQDGSRLLCATRNKLNLHQWPEDMGATFAELATSPQVPGEGPTPLILQWLELNPSPDWMCRSELLLPKMRELLSDERFEIKMATLGEYLRGVNVAAVPARKYTMDQVWHGMTLGKNADFMRRQSFEAESSLLAAETLAAINSLFGRPYAQWDVYPTWELEEQWRNLLMAQHHDNDECEGLCGHVGKAQYKLAAEQSSEILDKQFGRIRHLQGEKSVWIYNPLGWERQISPTRKVPAMGWIHVPVNKAANADGKWTVQNGIAKYSHDSFQVEVDIASATVTRIATSALPEGFAPDDGKVWTWCGKARTGEQFQVEGSEIDFENTECAWHGIRKNRLSFPIKFSGYDEELTFAISCDPASECVSVKLYGQVPPTAPGLNDAFGIRIKPPEGLSRIWTDEPYGVSEKLPVGNFYKKYPEGDWMTSPQWFEAVSRPFTSLSFVDFSDPVSQIGLQIMHKGARQWFLEDGGNVRHVIHAYDPWDEAYEEGDLHDLLVFKIHGSSSRSELWKRSQEVVRPCERRYVGEHAFELPTSFSALSCDAPNVVPTAFYRETEDFSGKYLADYAGKGIGYPFVVRLVEFDGIETEATLTIGGTVAKAFKTNFLGQVLEVLDPAKVKVHMRPFEIATVYLDIVEGRKQTRDLDAKRKIWATVHRVDD